MRFECALGAFAFLRRVIVVYTQTANSCSSSFIFDRAVVIGLVTNQGGHKRKVQRGILICPFYFAIHVLYSVNMVEKSRTNPTVALKHFFYYRQKSISNASQIEHNKQLAKETIK